jgi:integrase
MLELKKRVRKTKKGVSTLYYISGMYAGHRVRESLKTDKRETAQRAFEKKRAEIVAAIDAGTDRNLKFATAALKYMEAGKDDRFLAPLIATFGEEPISDFTSGYIQDQALKIYPKGKASTLNRQVIAPTLAVINWAAERRMCAPVQIKRFKEGKAARRAVTRDWVDKFRTAAAELDLANLGNMELFMFTTAARLADAQWLTWVKVDLEAKTATFLTKNGDERVAILTDEMVHVLRPLKGGDDVRVFGDWARRQMYGAWRAICKKAGLDYVPPHQAGRHSFATEAIVRNGVDVATTAALGGWKSPKLLLEVYTHPENSRKVAEEVFGRKSKPALKAVK